jgi:hypothetical protein
MKQMGHSTVPGGKKKLHGGKQDLDGSAAGKWLGTACLIALETDQRISLIWMEDEYITGPPQIIVGF